jgi:hypothetical protein
MMRLVLHTDNVLRGLAGEARGRIGEGLEGSLSAVEARARLSAPVRTGRLKDSIAAYLTGAEKGVLRAGAPYASFLHEGTGLYGPRGKAYVVTHRRKKALMWKGAAHPVKRVLIRGIRPRDFLRSALAGEVIREGFEKGFMGERHGTKGGS